MAAAAGLPFFHISHGDPHRAAGGLIQRCVAIGAGVQAGVELMAEHNVPGIFFLKQQFPDRVTLGTLFHGKSLLGVVACTA